MPMIKQAATALLLSPAFFAPSLASAHSDTEILAGIAQFFEGAKVVEGPKRVDCTLSGGTKTTCFSITVTAEPSTYIPGPWCPTLITDGPDAGGIWLEGGKVYATDGTFLKDLSEFYNDGKWQVYDSATGKVRVTDSREACEAAVRPDVAPEYQNYCVQCLPEYMAEGATQTYVIPIQPVPQDKPTPTNQTGAGVAANGVLLDGPAPVDAILGAYTIAPFDTCGGHVNLHAGYHYHAATDCLTDVAVPTSHAPQIGIAMDGYAILTQNLSDGTAAEGLDSCNGHDSDGLGYHYHAGKAGSNAILGCLSAEAGCHSDDPEAICDASVRRPRP